MEWFCYLKTEVHTGNMDFLKNPVPNMPHFLESIRGAELSKVSSGAFILSYGQSSTALQAIHGAAPCASQDSSSQILSAPAQREREGRLFLTCYCSDNSGSWCTPRGQPEALPCTAHHPAAGRVNDKSLEMKSLLGHPRALWLSFPTLITLSMPCSGLYMAQQHWAIVRRPGEGFASVCVREK